MLDVLADTYKIAARTDSWDLPRIELPRQRPVDAAAAARPESQRTQRLRFSPIRALVGFVHRRIERARTRSAILRMSEHQLQDIGMTRHDLLIAADGGHPR